jgi:hypothetical protein
VASAMDRRWQRFTDTSYRCPCCGMPVQGVLDVGYDHPDAWSHVSYRKNGGTVMVGQDVLTADFCSIGDTFFLRGLLSLPIRGTDANFAFGPWARVPPDTFRAYHAAFGTANEAALGFRQGDLANALPGFPDGAGTALRIRFLGGSDRPQFAPDATSALGQAQTGGISFDSLLDIYATFGHDLRPHLGDA